MFRIRTALLAAVLVTAGAAAHAGDRANVDPGMWEFNTTTSLKDADAFPPQDDSFQECLTEEEIISQSAILDGVDECTIHEQTMTSAQMVSKLTCPSQDGQEVNVSTRMSFNGESVEGQIISGVITSIGPFEVIVDIKGRRLGDC